MKVDNETQEKASFVKIVEPLMRAMQGDNTELAILSAGALVNLCNHSDDIREIFYQRSGHGILVRTIVQTRDDEMLQTLLKLVLSFAGESEKYHRVVAE